MAVKTDMNKAYNRLEWNFLLRVLRANGFNSRVCGLIMKCVSTVSYSILLNGAPLAPFNPKRGLRQGDPLSPFLFILCSKVLSKLISKAEGNGNLVGVKVARRSTSVSHIFYADDSMFFCQANERNARTLLNCLQKYEKWSGQSVSKAKSGVFFSPNTSARCKEDITNLLGMGWLKQSEKYLGNPFFFSANKRKDYHFLKEKILGHLEGWKARHLSQAGRTVLEMDKPWVKVMLEKYCHNSNPWIVEKQSRDSWSWKSILDTRKVCLDNAGILIADGDSEIWDRPWIPEVDLQAIKDSFHYVNNQALWKFRDLFTENSCCWNVNLIRKCFDDHIASEILKIHPIQEGRDIVFWKAAKSGNFSVKSAYWAGQQDSSKAETILLETFLQHAFNGGKFSFWSYDPYLCPFCLSAAENGLHLFCQCPVTRGIWFLRGISLDCFGWTNLEEFGRWWRNLKDSEIQTFIACTCDTVWKWRNEMVFKEKPLNVNLLIRDCLDRCNRFLRIWNNCEDPEARESSLDIPEEPPDDHWRCSVDASVAGGRAGFAVFHRQQELEKSWLAVGVGNVEGVLEGELRAIELALESGLKHQVVKIWVETDSKVAALAFKNARIPYGWRVFPLFSKCMNLCERFESVIVTYVPRTSNVHADSLARWARESNCAVSGLLREVAPCCGH
ncbi:uncharacterized protein LOC115695006 [Cannabis sativa]|uniref:uncharacterized protein LOC115695006 n=1 Tax=Cannabis sativa TaxID=3483 RepID=UPI0011DFEC5B|nr:uncharacterized protein LOC115695006 [Cannabis sativa]